MLKDDFYIPCGIILKTLVYKSKDKNQRMIILGNSNIILFKDDKMQNISKVIPICHCNIIFKFDNQKKSITIKTASNSLEILFFDCDTFNIWKSVKL